MADVVDLLRGAAEDPDRVRRVMDEKLPNPTPPAPVQTASVEAVLTVDDLAQEIRRVDGSHSLGAGALAEALAPFITISFGKVLASLTAPTQGDGLVSASSVEYLLSAADDRIAHLERATPSSPVSSPSPAGGVREALGSPDGWRKQREILEGWTGSAFLAGEKVADPAWHKRKLYGDLNRLVSWLHSAEDAARAALSSPATGEVVEALRDYPARIWVERDEETNEKRWFSIAGAGVEYVRAGVSPLSKAAADVLAERSRQIEVEGWTPAHDDAHTDGEMADAAALYASLRVRHITGFATWPWDAKWWKPKDRRRDLVRAGALIVAEIERLDRKIDAALNPVPGHGEGAPAAEPWFCGGCGQTDPAKRCLGCLHGLSHPTGDKEGRS